MALSLAVFVIHQLSYAENVALAGQLSESIKIVNRCTPEALGPLNTFHPIIDTEILNISWKTMLEPQNYTIKLWIDDDTFTLGLLVYGADDVDGGVQKIHLDIWHSTRQHRAHIRKVCGRVIGHAAGRTWHGVDGQALNYIADHAQIGTLLGGAACVFTTLGIIYAVRRYHSIIAIK
ncbi:hypothetical protein N7491_006287 [Penicillium cf. griseofulvum]|nr:hypothetical protein N7491_006287 [Penicillium cf. griseofulvum]